MLTKAQAKKAGKRAGANAASWAFDGNTSDRTYETAVEGFDDGDPEVYDRYEPPSWLSGEFAGESINELLNVTDRDQARSDFNERLDEIAGIYEQAANDAFYQEIERTARKMAPKKSRVRKNPVRERVADRGAAEILAACNIPLGANFHTLNHSQVDALLTEADLARYRKPRNANGSRGRYFHEHLQRRAAKHGRISQYHRKRIARNPTTTGWTVKWYKSENGRGKPVLVETGFESEARAKQAGEDRSPHNAKSFRVMKSDARKVVARVSPSLSWEGSRRALQVAHNRNAAGSSVAVRTNAPRRKMEDEWTVQGLFERRWEDVTSETTSTEARQRLREYRDNDPGHAYRMIHRRVPVQSAVAVNSGDKFQETMAAIRSPKWSVSYYVPAERFWQFAFQGTKAEANKRATALRESGHQVRVRRYRSYAQ